jgi:protein-tyrosine phosphatase
MAGLKGGLMRLPAWLRRGAAGAAESGPGEDTPGVLFVCMGNICRSPTAEAVLRLKLRQAGLHEQVRVDSAGTGGWHAGEPPDPRAVRVAEARGYDLAPLRARQVRAEDFSRHRWVLAMDQDNLSWLRGKAPPEAAAELGLLMAHAQRHRDVLEVPDPYYGTQAGFERVLDLVEDACDGLLARLQADLGSPR